MEDIRVGQVVENITGRDSKDLFVVIKVDKEFVYIANGKNRRVESPKRKNKKHIVKICFKDLIPVDENSKDIANENAKIRKILKEIKSEDC